MMMNVQTASASARWHPSFGQPALKLERDERWSDFSEVLSLLNFDGQVQEVNASLFRRRRLKAGQSALSMGQSFQGLYVVRLGALKTSLTDVDGVEHVVAFPMKGDLLGSDGICRGRYLSEVVALTDCDLIRIPSETLFSPEHSGLDLERVAYWAISREIFQEQTVGTLTYSPKSEVRVARFLRVQSERFAAQGCSPNQFILPMTRRDIGNYLNVTLETVSRALSSLSRHGIIAVERREIKILSQAALRDFGS
ncbi:MAG: helix-turn-helix domain-containing protein [Rhodoferax sp.]|uniref:Crp/Fnr family transcriptional regulator n=1 Tax=Rhodoferax sp. TaxID=50421 RepID=UPI0026151F15|nr:helix-turn-helix domain-containing protein [Rhodoferax sp.]MDD5335662.1 helix-turn-helix domain-containing protein [Rhodoferax sp.]